MKTSKKVLVLLVIALVGGVLVFTGWAEWQNSKKLVAEGKAATATVVDKQIHRGRRGSKTYYMTVRFKTEAGSEAQPRVKVSSADFESANTRAQVPVHYLADNPDVCQVGAKAETKWANLVLGLVSWVAGGFVAFSKKGNESEGATGDSATPDAGSSAEGSASGGPDQAAA